jgi:hypothetical protein
MKKTACLVALAMLFGLANVYAEDGTPPLADMHVDSNTRLNVLDSDFGGRIRIKNKDEMYEIAEDIANNYEYFLEGANAVCVGEPVPVSRTSTETTFGISDPKETQYILNIYCNKPIPPIRVFVYGFDMFTYDSFNPLSKCISDISAKEVRADILTLGLHSKMADSLNSTEDPYHPCDIYSFWDEFGAKRQLISLERTIKSYFARYLVDNDYWIRSDHFTLYTLEIKYGDEYREQKARYMIYSHPENRVIEDDLEQMSTTTWKGTASDFHDWLIQEGSDFVFGTYFYDPPEGIEDIYKLPEAEQQARLDEIEEVQFLFYQSK